MGTTQIGPDDLARALYAAHGVRLLAFVQRLVGGDRQLAEDIVQETMLRAWRHGDELEVATARPWLYTTARRLVVDHYRARAARPTEVRSDRFDDLTDYDAIDHALDAVLVIDALASLTRDHRRVLIECYYNGRTPAELAAADGLPAGTVRSRLHYGLRALRLALQERGVIR